MTKILIVEDEESMLEPLQLLLSNEGFQIECAKDGISGLKKFQEQGADLVLLDLMLPGMSGTEVCKQIRKDSMVPIIMLTAKDSEVDKVVGLEIGADDYVTKPYSTRELVARINAVLRRKISGSVEKSSNLLVAGHIELDAEKHVVSISGKTVSFPLKEFELLEYLIRNDGRVLTRTQLIDRVWGNDYFGDTKTLDVHIKRLRAKIETDPANPTYIQTIRGLGYKFQS
jgi:two-component system response regulator RegX3